MIHLFTQKILIKYYEAGCVLFLFQDSSVNITKSFSSLSYNLAVLCKSLVQKQFLKSKRSKEIFYLMLKDPPSTQRKHCQF